MMIPPTPHELRAGCSFISCKYHSLKSVKKRPTNVESPEAVRPISNEERLADINRWLDEQHSEPPDASK